MIQELNEPNPNMNCLLIVILIVVCMGMGVRAESPVALLFMVFGLNYG
jgi:hypothetical protein